MEVQDEVIWSYFDQAGLWCSYIATAMMSVKAPSNSSYREL